MFYNPCFESRRIRVYKHRIKTFPEAQTTNMFMSGELHCFWYTYNSVPNIILSFRLLAACFVFNAKVLKKYKIKFISTSLVFILLPCLG